VRLWKIELQKAGRRDRPRDPRPPLSAWNIEVEQDQTPVILPHLYHIAELAWPAAHRSLALVELIGATMTKTGLKKARSTSAPARKASMSAKRQ
jgi:hypothetical protein